MILVEITAAIDTSGTTKVLRVSDGKFVTAATDTPPKTLYYDRLLDPGWIEVNAYSEDKTSGGTKLDSGEIVIGNQDGKFDEWLEYSYDGRSVVIRQGPEGGAYPTDFPIIVNGTAEGIQSTFSKITIRLKDKQYILQTPILTTRYAGTNSAGSGLEGAATDIKGKVKPRVFGKVLNISPVQVNSSSLSYETGVCASYDAVRDRGSALTNGGTFANSADMVAGAVPSSNFKTVVAEGYFRLGTRPSGLLTSDVTEGATAADRTVAQLLKKLALLAGVPSVSSSDVTALDTANPSVVGIWINDEAKTYQQAMDDLAASIGAYYYIDGTDTLRMGVLAAPSGTPVGTLHDHEVEDAFDRRPARDYGVPVWSVTVNYSKIWTNQASDLAGVVSMNEADKQYYSTDYRTVTQTDATVKTQWKMARTMTIDTLLTDSTAATSEATRLLNLYKVPRYFYDVPMSVARFQAKGFKLLDVIKVYNLRFGMGSGKLLRILGYRIDLSRNRVTLVLWG